MRLDKVDVGQQIKLIRLSLGYTQEEFGLKFKPEASGSLVSSWEKGRHMPNPERLNDIAFWGQISVDELLYGKPETCSWKVSDPVNRFYLYNVATDCGLSEDLIVDEPIPKGYKYCPYCGKELIISE